MPPKDASRPRSGDGPSETLGVMPPEDASQPRSGDGPSETFGVMPPEDEMPEQLSIRLEQRKHTIAYVAGDTILEAARRGGLGPPFSCEQGNCATCMAHLDTGTVTMRANNVLSTDEVEDGWILTCQSVPTSAELAVDYDA